MAAQDIIIRPIITEKTMDGTTQKKYTFEVDKKSTKIDVKRAVEELFGVKVQKVNTLHVRGRMRRQGRFELPPCNGIARLRRAIACPGCSRMSFIQLHFLISEATRRTRGAAEARDPITRRTIPSQAVSKANGLASWMRKC